MLLGPVFNAELLTTARRARYYIVRFLYGLIILFQIYLSYDAASWRFGNGQRDLRINEMTAFALEVFMAFAIVQAVVVLLLTPALVGGTIADERQRKTLHYLLTSQLTSAEIILGKLAARLLQVGVLVALGLPIVSLMGLFGGIDPLILVVTYAATFTTMYLLASVSIFISVISRRPREAISLIYVLEIAWLFAPAAMMALMTFGEPPWREIGKWVNPVLEYIALTSPFFFVMPFAYRATGGPITPALWGMGLQVLYGTIFVVLAMVRLRPSARTEGGEKRGLARWAANLQRKRRWFPRPSCGDDGMLWKEMHVSRTSGLAKSTMAVVAVASLGFIGYWGLYYFVPAWEEMLRDGYSNFGPNRREFNGYLRVVCTLIYVLWFLGVASAASSGLSSEREEDQWLALLSTPMSGFEILRAKMIGPVWGLRFLAYLIFGIFGAGLVVGSLHPLGLIACLIEFVVFSWFLTALGTFFSLRSKNSTRSLATTMALLIFLNGAYMFCCIPFQPNTEAIAAGSTPYIFAVSMLSLEDLNRIGQGYNRSGEAVVACVIGVLFYGVAAAGLTASLFSTFDTVVDRPDRFRQNRPANQEREFLKGRTEEIKYQDELV